MCSLFKGLKEYRGKNYISLHMPGHKSGEFLPPEMEDAFGKRMFEYDITETEGMDNLQNPQGLIKETEEKISGMTGADRAFLLVNGSTLGILASIYALARNQEIFLGGNCHQAAYHGMILGGSHPIFLSPEIDERSGMELGVSPATLLLGIKKYPQCKVVMLTFPNYFGLRYKMEEIIKIAKENNLILIIDEAHGAHFNFMKRDFPNAISLGADVVVQSWHKTLPVLNQGSVLLAGERMRDVDLRGAITLFQTTSPSYLIMSTIDAAADYFSDKEEMLRENGQHWQLFFSSKEFKNLKIYENKEEKTDPFKLVIFSEKNFEKVSKEILISKYKIQPEILDGRIILFMLPLLFNKELGEKIKMALDDIDGLLQNEEEEIVVNEPKREKVRKFPGSPIELSLRKKVKVPVEDSIGKICGQKIVKYPPGVPLVYPGEVMTEEIVCYLNRHKINYNLQEGIQILTD